MNKSQTVLDDVIIQGYEGCYLAEHNQTDWITFKQIKINDTGSKIEKEANWWIDELRKQNGEPRELLTFPAYTALNLMDEQEVVEVLNRK